MSRGDYLFFQRFNASRTTDVEVLTGTQNYTGAITCRSANHVIWIQKITLNISTHAAQTITFRDTAATPLQFGSHLDAATGVDSIVYDFGPKGKACTIGKDFAVSQAAAGIGGNVHIEAYERLGAAVAIASTN